MGEVLEKVKTTFGGKVKPTKKLKSVLWSPFRGDKLYPFFNDEGKMIAFSREYKKKLMDDSEITCFMTITDKMVYQWDLSKGMKKERLLLMDSQNYRFSMLIVQNLIARR